MNLEIQKTCEILLKSSELSTDNDYEDFESALAELSGTEEIKVVEYMLDSFNDTESHELFEVMSTQLEVFPLNAFLEIFFQKAISLYKRTPFWFNRIFYPLINYEEEFSIFFSIYKNAPNEIQIFFYERIQEIVQENKDSEYYDWYSSILSRLSN